MPTTNPMSLICFAACALSVNSFRTTVDLQAKLADEENASFSYLNEKDSIVARRTRLELTHGEHRAKQELPEGQPELLKDDSMFQCPQGATAAEGCRSLCKILGLTGPETPNGECPEFEQVLANAGYGNAHVTWNFFRWRVWKQSSMDAILDDLCQNAGEHQSAFLITSLDNRVRQLPDNKVVKYKLAIVTLTRALSLYQSLHPHFDASAFHPPVEDDGGTDPLPQCSGPIQAGDILTFENGGPDFSEISSELSKTAANHEALQLRLMFDYGLNFEHKLHYEYRTPAQDAAFSAKVGEFFKNLAKGGADCCINMGKGIGNAVLFVGKVAGDVLANTGMQLARGLTFTGAGITAGYASVRQTTSHTGTTKFTHSELALSEHAATQGPGGAVAICDVYRVPGKIIVSRFSGDKGHVIRNSSTSMQLLAAHRADQWWPYLQHYADTVGQWHRVVFGKCFNTFGNSGDPDYWQAVTDEKIKEMWDYTPTDEQNREGFWKGVRDSIKKTATGATHDANQQRLKPKAMFCSKFTAAVWSSVIGNPTEDPDAPVRHDDVNKMFPLNPGACAPWSMVQWLLSARGRQSWDSCLIDQSAAGSDGYQPCAGR